MEPLARRRKRARQDKSRTSLPKARKVLQFAATGLATEGGGNRVEKGARIIE
jgi:hypothetical protein